MEKAEVITGTASTDNPAPMTAWMEGDARLRVYDGNVVAQLIAAAGRPWCLKPEAMEMLVEALSAGTITGHTHTGPPFPAPARSAGSIAVIPLSGLITPSGGGPLGQLLGLGAGLTHFRQELAGAAADNEVKHIILEVNSPGGMVDHVPETAASIREARNQKPVTAVASTQAASAAYWLASQADELVVTPSGEVGSIGVYMMHTDKSKALENDGLSVTLTSAGEYKTEGNSYQPLSDEGRRSQQQKVDRFYEMFIQDVGHGRGESPEFVAERYGKGRTIGAEEAVEAGSADRIGTVDQVLGDVASGMVASGEVSARRRRRVELLA